jgi:iron complex transport system permease protein
MNRRAVIAFVGLAVLLIAAVAARLLVGRDLDAFPSDLARMQVLELRGMQALQGLIVGAALGAGGVLLQALLRNPLASPDLLGLSAGAGLAVMVSLFVAAQVDRGGADLQTGREPAATGQWAMDGPADGADSQDRPEVGPSSTLGYLQATWQAGPALIGSLGALALVYSLSRRRGMVDPPTLVLIGVMVSILCGAGVTLVMSLMPQASMRPLLGSLSTATPMTLIVAAGAITAAGVAIGMWAGPAMDAASLGDDEAISVGVPLARLRLTLFIVSGVMTAGAVVIAGPIGFVGLVCPHAVRLTAGPRHRGLVIGSALAGGALLVGSDALVSAVRTDAGRVPLGVVTALIGGPVFIWLLRRSWVA